MYGWLRYKGFQWNHKRVYWVYVSKGMSMRRKVKKRLSTRAKESMSYPIDASICWIMDFMYDMVKEGSDFSTWNVLNDFNREVGAQHCHRYFYQLSASSWGVGSAHRMAREARVYSGR